MTTLLFHHWLFEIDWPRTIVFIVLPMLALAIVLLLVIARRRQKLHPPKKKEALIVCPKCGYKSTFYFQVCASCSYDMKSGAFRDKSREPMAQRADGLCPFCHGEIDVGVAKCKHCGEWLDPAWRQLFEKAVHAQITTGGVATFIAVLLVISILSQIIILVLSR